MKQPGTGKQFDIFGKVLPVGMVAVLLLLCAAVSLVFVHQYTVILGAVSGYLSPEEMTALVSGVFRHAQDNSYYAKGLMALERAGYGGFSHHFLMKPMLPCILMAAVLLLGVIFVSLWSAKRAQAAREEEHRRIIDWIRSSTTEAPSSPFYAPALIRAIADQKMSMQKQAEIHNEDTA